MHSAPFALLNGIILIFFELKLTDAKKKGIEFAPQTERECFCTTLDENIIRTNVSNFDPQDAPKKTSSKTPVLQ